MFGNAGCGKFAAKILFSLVLAVPASSVHARDCAGGTCSQMRSCEEAVYETYACGQRKLDRDGDGVPCEKLCTPASVAKAKSALGLN